MKADMKRSLWFAWVLLLSLSTARGGIPDNNINHAVLLEFENRSQASGFVLMAEDRLFFIPPPATGGILYRVIGLVSERVPQAEQWVNPGLHPVNLEVSNSGYSTVVPMEVVYELVASSVAVPMVIR